MKSIRHIEFWPGVNEEKLPGFSEEFPYITTRAVFNESNGSRVPWHWHSAVELFYMEKGALEYATPGKTLVFPQGAGGLLNSDVLHATRQLTERGECVQLLHIFEPAFIAGPRGSRLDRRYVAPILGDPSLEILPILPNGRAAGALSDLLRQSFQFDAREIGYEFRLRAALSEIWMRLYDLSLSRKEGPPARGANTDKLKMMMIYVHEHYAQKISIAQIAAAAYLSERECYRTFRENLRLTPVQYVVNYRLQAACGLLKAGEASISAVGQACGFGSSSYFGKLFLQYHGCTPREYQRHWQDPEKTGREPYITFPEFPL